MKNVCFVLFHCPISPTSLGEEGGGGSGGDGGILPRTIYQKGDKNHHENNATRIPTFHQFPKRI